MTKQRRVYAQIALGCFLVAAFFGWSLAQAQETPIIDGEATVTLSWTAPTQYENGEPLPAIDLTGYVIYYDTEPRETSGVFRQGCFDGPQDTRTDASCYGNVIDLTDGSATSRAVVLTVDQTTTFYFAAVAHVANGEWSRYSNEATKTVTLVIDWPQPGPPTGVDVTFDIICTTNLPTVTCEFVVQ